MLYVFDAPEQASLVVHRNADRFPVGRNYEAHARVMGKDLSREPPFFFTKAADICPTP